MAEIPSSVHLHRVFRDSSVLKVGQLGWCLQSQSLGFRFSFIASRTADFVVLRKLWEESLYIRIYQSMSFIAARWLKASHPLYSTIWAGTSLELLLKTNNPSLVPDDVFCITTRFSFEINFSLKEDAPVYQSMLKLLSMYWVTASAL